MKKIIIVCISILLIAVAAIYATDVKSETQYLRIHIRANSNSQIDQQVKYKVKTEVVEFLTPYLANVNSKQEAQAIINSKITQLSAAATKVLAANGFSYTATAKLTQEQFPARLYDELVLESGIYDALIIELGNAQGDNWWCVVYPPLCFVGSDNNGTNAINYKWKLQQIIDKFFNK